MDAFIAAEATAGEPLRLPFHDRYFALMSERGFDDETATLYLGFFFQLRRTFYFIERNLPSSSKTMERFREALWNNVLTFDRKIYATRIWRRMEDFSTLLLGETGTSKGSAAAAIGQSGFIPYNRSTKQFQASFTQSFVSLNLCQFPESLIESELFGHRKGAFTGAIVDHQGALARCNEFSALFLDEIGEVGVPVQVKLLQVLQDRTYNPVGHTTPARFAGRVIAATNRTYEALRVDDGFRDDFLYRLCSDVIEVPTLRGRVAERPEELNELVAVIVERIVGEADARLSALVLESLNRDLPVGYSWPRNVRELEQAVRRVMLTGGCKTTAAASSVTGDDTWQQMQAGQLRADEVVGRYCAMLYAVDPVYSNVAEKTGLDRRTVRKHVQNYLGHTSERS